MRYEYTLTYRDYLDAQKLYRRHRWTAALSYYVWIWFLPIAGLLVSLPLIAGVLGYRPDRLRSLAGLSGVGLWFAIVIPVLRIYGVRKCWKKMLPESVKKSTSSVIPVELEMTAEQLISALPGRSEGRFFWPAIVDYTEDENLALIFIKKKLFLFVPRRGMDEAGWVELRRYLARFGAASS